MESPRPRRWRKFWRGWRVNRLERDRLHVLERHIEAPFQQRVELRPDDERLRATRADAVAHIIAHHRRCRRAVGVGGHHHLRHETGDVGRDGHRQAQRPHPHDGRPVHHRRGLGRLAAGRPVDDGDQLIDAGEGHVDLEHEAVELRLGQRIRALHLERVLGGQHEKRRVQPIYLAADRHGLLLHHLQQGRLGLGGGAVNLVGQHEVGENRAVPKAERLAPAIAFLEDVRADDVRGHHVGRELNARELQRQRVGQGADELSLAQPGHPLQQDVPPRQHPNQHAADDRLLADDDTPYLGLDRPCRLAKFFYRHRLVAHRSPSRASHALTSRNHGFWCPNYTPTLWGSLLGFHQICTRTHAPYPTHPLFLGS